MMDSASALRHAGAEPGGDMATRPALRGEGISIGRVFDRGFGALSADWRLTIGLPVLIGGVPGMAMAIVLGDGIGAIDYRILGAGALVVWIVNFLLYLLCHGLVVAAVAARLDGGRLTAGAAVSAAARAVPALVGASIVIFLACLIGMGLFFVPGVMLWVIWAVATPAAVVERDGVFAALGRSRALTKGARWPVFGLLLVLLIAYSAVTGTVGFGAGLTDSGPGVTGTPVGIMRVALGSLVGAAVNAAWSAIQTALYIELRDWKDGPSADRLADVFA